MAWATECPDRLAAVLGEVAETFRPSCLLSAALHGRLFILLPAAGASPSDIAASLGLSTTAARVLLNALSALGLVTLRRGLYRLRDDLRPLLADGPQAIVKELLLYRRENAIWLRAPAILRADESAPVEYQRELLDSRLRDYPGIQTLNRTLARAILDTLDLVGQARRVLDIGGGDGLYAGLVLGRNTTATVRVLDLETGLAMCAAYAEHLRTGRLQLEAGDARTFRPRATYDLVMLNELLELFPRAEKKEILRRAAAALVPGGHVVVTKFALDADGAGPASSALFSLRMRLKTSDSYLETDDEVRSLLAECGCEALRTWRVHDLKAVIVGRRPHPSGLGAVDPAQPGNSCPTKGEDETVTTDELSEGQIGLWRELVSLATSFRTAAVLFAAADLDLFSRIPPDGCDARSAADRLAMPEVGVRVLMNALAAIGLLQHEAGRYAMHPDLRALLARGPHCILPEILQYRRENEVWLDLLGVLRRDRSSSSDVDEVSDGTELGQYLTAVEITNRQSAERLIRRLQPLLADARSALDIGGGGGGYSTLLLEASPHLRVTLLDRPPVIERCRSLLAGHPHAGRLDLVAGDALDFRLPPAYDVILISDLLHYFSGDDKRRVLQNARLALSPGGTVVVSKFTLDESGTSPPAAALFSLKVHVKRLDAYLETDGETAAIMRDLGFDPIHVEALDSVKTMVIGRAGRATRSTDG